MYKQILFVAIVTLLVSSMALGSPPGGQGDKPAGISQRQTTSLVVSGGTWGYGITSATSGGTVYAKQNATTNQNTASQTANSTINSSSSSWWGAVATWFSGWASTWQEQKVD